ncbi:hypothetical protein BN940_03771 [Castellaniella defragrans 65Phen]|uniref:Uncharacterized protein n=1 Tax=Castellaniella defragrans (strain DSM 12143 / CCUG 39792 / 65Phen) TaxID=1437824 RepID=W8WU83_CASD6|nr:hypothetical protein BN940_03771 [Castellaniella defragrans 65Phen]
MAWGLPAEDLFDFLHVVRLEMINTIYGVGKRGFKFVR